VKLVLEGGGVRAAYSAGVCRGLIEAGVRPEVVIASSSGTLNAAFVASGQTDALCDLWQELTPHRGLISWRRQLTPFARPGLDIDMLLDDILVGEAKLDIEKAVAGSPALYLTATDVARCAGYVARPNRNSLIPWLRAALAFPAGYHHEVRISGVRYVDGGVALPVPFDVAELEAYSGPTVVVLTRRAATEKAAPRWFERFFVYAMVPKGAQQAVLRQHQVHNQTMRRLRLAEASGVLVSSPPPGMPLSRFTTDEEKVRQGIAMGREEGKAIAQRLHR
jgi:predicted patatin/cPLA2 family phospholipase